MKIAVTSASGKLGASIVKHLINLVGKDNVIGVARTPEKAAYLGVEIRKGDYNSREQFNAALKGVDAVLLVSGMDAPDKRIIQHRNVIEAAIQNGVKKIVYTSIVGAEEGNAFSPIVQTNRQTEKDLQNSGLEWVIGRNGIYIEPDLEYLETYIKEGEIRNCAANGKCTYTSREELGYGYAKMLTEDKHHGQVYNLVGEPVTQSQLTGYMNQVFHTSLIYHSVSVADYKAERVAALGDFIGTVIAGIYEGIKEGANDVSSDYKVATGRAHISTIDMMKVFKETLD
ncbi:SDR family oxidoreductase [Bizionia arctica]|uniref:NAD(P)-dependent oxidoreductase n=1 Tax=Bizionia arctica TaxID=1495645 RepID=A0A917GHZ6_9FLAO|nr:SDR family oxidoreductase [Bizionia arctica]GGG47042.1 NAD(P)-dependent oxidoreductase [Bizionia arctica]